MYYREQKSYKSLTAFFAIIFSALVISCGSAGTPEINEFGGVSHTEKGEKALLEWDFANADSVVIDGIKGSFKAVDSYYVSPDTTTVYPFTAFGDDNLKQVSWTVFVDEEIISEEKNPGTKAKSEYQELEKTTPAKIPHNGEKADGPFGKNIDEEEIVTETIPASYTESEFFRGTLKSDDPGIIKRFKVMKTKIMPDGKNIRLRALVMDDFGNFIKGLPEKALSNVSVFHNCETGIVGEPVFYTGAKSDKGTRPTDMVICVEKSAAAVYLPEAHKQLRDFLDTSSFNLMTSLYYFNQEIEQKTGFMRPKEVINLLDKETNNPLISGTSSLYRCAIRAINELEGRTSSEKAVVIMAFSYDNSSIIYDVDRVSQKAKELDIPVYVISVGSAVDSYPLRNLSYMSGGNYYSLSEEEYSKIPLIMDEIAASFEMYYEYEMPYKALKEGLCSNVKSEITLKTDKLEAKDIFRIVSPPSGIHQAYQSLAVFSFRDTVVDNQYMPNLRVLSQVLRDNPDAKVQLTGHSWQEGNSDAAKRLSLRRAQSARKALISLGVDPMQIRVTHEGDSSPVYYLAGQKWMNLYNRRVEIKWLDPEFLPYEIIAQTEPSETVALEKVEKWENLGYRAYFERALNNGIPVYRVVLWGYDTLEKAETALNTIEKNHKLEAYIK